MALPKKPKRLPAGCELPFEYDFEHPAAEVLTSYAGLLEMLGHELPSPEAAPKFLYAFHDEQRMEQAQAELPEYRLPG